MKQETKTAIIDTVLVFVTVIVVSLFLAGIAYYNNATTGAPF